MATLNELFETYVNDNYAGVMSRAAIVNAYELLLGLTGDFPAKDERVQFWVDQELSVSEFVDAFLAAAARLSEDNAAAWGETTAGRTAVVTAAQDAAATATTLEEIGTAVAAERANYPVDTGEGETFTLTTAADTLAGTSQNDTFVATDTTLTAGDSLTGGEGIDELKYSAAISADVSHGALTTSGVEQLTVTVDSTVAADTVSFDLSGAAGLQTVKVDNSSASVTFGQLTSLVDVEINDLTGTAGTTTVQFKDTVVTGTADSVNLAISGADMGTLVVGSVADPNGGVETIAVTTSGQATTIATLNSDITTLEVDGDQDLTITNALNATVTAISAASLTGALTATLNASASDVAVNTGEGNDVINAAANTGVVTADLGAGDDTLVMGANLISTDVIDGGAGTDTLTVTTITVAQNGTLNAAGETFANTTSVETLAFSAATSGTLDAGAFDATTNTDGSDAAAAGIMTYAFEDGANGAVTLSNVNDNSTVTFTAEGVATGANGQNLTVTNGTDGSTDTLNLIFDLDTTNDSLSTLTADDAETLNVTVNDSDAAVVDGVTIATLDSDDLTTLVASGAGSLTITNTITNGALGTVNAADLAGALAIAVDDATDVSAETAQDVTVASADANDTITLGGANNYGAYTVDSGNGDDTITLTSAANTVAHTVTVGDSDADTVGNGVVDVVGATATVSAGDNGWTVTTDTGADTITTGAGDDIIDAGEGNDTVVAGEGDDVITAGRGVDNLDGGAGDDQFNFVYGTTPSTEGLTSADTVVGGEGTDTISMTTGNVTLTDQIFNGVSGVENLDLAGNGTNSVTINTIGLAAGIENVKGGTGNDTLNIGEGFTGSLTLDLSDGGNDTVTATSAPGAMTIFAQDGDIDANDTLIGGTSSDDVLSLEAANGTATVSAMTAVESINIVQNTTSAATEEYSSGLTLGADTVIADGTTLTIDATDMTASDTDADANYGDFTFDGSAETTGTTTNVNLTSGAGNDDLTLTSGDDTVDAGAGNDVITGGAGQDTMTGGAGSDDFVFNALTESNGTTEDTIMDFTTSTSTTTNDEILIASSMVGGRTTEAFGGNAADFTEAQSLVSNGSGETQYVFQQDTNTLWIDANDDGTLNNQDIKIVLDGVTSLNTTSNTDVRVFIDSEIASFTTTSRTDTLAITADNVGDGAADELTLNDTAAISALTVTGWENVTIAAGATVTMTDAQHDTDVLGGATVTATGTQTVQLSDTVNTTGRSDIESYVLQSTGSDVFAVGAVDQNIDISAGGNDGITLFGEYVGTVTGENAGDTFNLQSGTDISGNTTLDTSTVTVNVLSGSVTMTDSQHDDLVGAELTSSAAATVTITDAASIAADANIAGYTLSTGGTIDVTSNTAVNVTGATGSATTVTINAATVTGDYSLQNNVADTLTVTNGADISGVNSGGDTTAETLDMSTVETMSVTMTSAQYAAFTTINTNADDEIITLTTGTTAVTANDGVATYNLQEGQSITNTGATAAGRDTVLALTGTGTTTVTLGAQAFTGTWTGFEAGDVIRTVTGTDISAVVGIDSATVDFQSATSSVQLDAGQNGTMTFSNAATGTQTVIVDEADTFVANSAIEVYQVNGGNVTVSTQTQTITEQSNVAQTVTVAGGTVADYDGTVTFENTTADTLVITGTADITDATFNNFGAGDALTITDASVTMTDSQYDNLVTAATVTAGNTETVTISDAATIIADAVIENYILSSTGNDTITFADVSADAGNVTISAGGSDIIAITNSGALTGVNASNAVTVTGFDVANDTLDLASNGAAHNTGFQTIASAGAAITAPVAGIIEIASSLTQYVDATAIGINGAIEQLLANNIGTIASGEYTAIVYGASGAAVYQFSTDAAAGDMALANVTGLELVGMLSGVAADALAASNFA